ncbi:MAG: hypothetical protein SGI77_23435 [Pirellulaceae bacterium]|nr:hypothetical protein [Pirellulaceae bacterium]
MTVWQPALNQPRAVKTIAMTPIYGPEELAAKLNQAMIEAMQQSGSPITLLHPQLLEEMTSIQLASFDGQPSDVAGMNAARRAKADVLLQGQIVQSQLQPQEPKNGRFDTRKRPSEQITVAWTVTDVESGARLSSNTITVDREQAERNYPELAISGGENVDRVIAGLSRESWKMFSPMTTKEDAVLALPWFLPGASKIRQGNGFARQGRWDAAEKSWQDAVSKHPSNNAAWNNLALAAVAHEDFELGRSRVEHAKSMVPWDRARKTERWIDEHQHNYHRAQSLPDREGGWLVPDPPPPVALEDVPPVRAIDIDELPWWTAIPGTKPPGWTWKQWLSQPRAL